MFCKTYSQSLKDAAARREALSPALQQHLASCASCRDAFAEEQSIFAAIDFGLHVEANSEVPATLIPRIRVALNNEPAIRPRRLLSVWGFAGAVTAAVVLALVYLPSKHQLAPVESSRPSPINATKNPAGQSALNSAHVDGVSPLQQRKPVVLVVNRGLKSESPEVIVPPDERIAFLRYEEFLRKKQTVVLIGSVKSLDLPPGIEPLQIAEIEIPALSKPYPEGDAK